MPSIWFKHPVDSLSDNSRIKALVRRFGSAGYAAYFALLEKLYRNNGEPVSIYEAESLARDLKMNPQKMLEILEYAAGRECDELIQKSDQGYESRKVVGDIKYNKTIAKKKSYAGKKGMQKRWRDKSIMQRTVE